MLRLFASALERCIACDAYVGILWLLWRNTRRTVIRQQRRNLDRIDISSHDVDRILRIPLRILVGFNIVCILMLLSRRRHIQRVSLCLRQDSTRFRAVKHLLEIDRCVERLRRILLLYLLLAAIYRLRHHLLVHGIVVLGLLIVLIRCIGSNLYQSWLRL